MHRCQYNKTWSNQDKFPAGNLNWHNVKTMLPSHNNNEEFRGQFYQRDYVQLLSQQGSLRAAIPLANSRYLFGFIVLSRGGQIAARRPNPAH